MERSIPSDHPIRTFLAETLAKALHRDLGLPNAERVDHYLVDMMVNFLHHDRLYAIRDAEGRPVNAVAEMLAEADIRLNADSFEREREVHRHIGDYLLFWSGLFPEALKRMKSGMTPDAFVDVTKQGAFSYHVVSTFTHPPYEEEAPVFERLSAEFEAYQEGLRRVRAHFPGLGAA